jgi:hypothetical protein
MSTSFPLYFVWYSPNYGRSAGLTTFSLSIADYQNFWKPQLYGSRRAFLGLHIDHFLPLPLNYNLCG